jgi:hypothetical protein
MPNALPHRCHTSFGSFQVLEVCRWLFLSLFYIQIRTNPELIASNLYSHSTSVRSCLILSLQLRKGSTNPISPSYFPTQKSCICLFLFAQGVPSGSYSKEPSEHLVNNTAPNYNFLLFLHHPLPRSLFYLNVVLSALHLLFSHKCYVLRPSPVHDPKNIL